jgi:predicted nucleic acid-binding protein
MGPLSVAALTDITGTRLYLDTNVIIYAAEGTAALPASLKGALLRVDAGQLSAVTSELTLAEVLVKPLRDQDAAMIQRYESRLTSGPSLTVAPVSRGILARAAELRAGQTSLKLPDAIHAATALLHGCTTFLTNDARFETVGPLPVLLLSRMP